MSVSGLGERRPLLVARELVVERRSKRARFELAVEQLELFSGEVLAIVGPNGAGDKNECHKWKTKQRQGIGHAIESCGLWQVTRDSLRNPD